MVVSTGTVPIYNEYQRNTRWNMNDIYTGSNGKGRYVPRVDDEVWDWEQGLFRVVAVDTSTGLSTLLKYKTVRDAGSLTDDDILLGAGPGSISESFRAFIDTSVMPYTLALDARLHIYGTTASFIKIFKGSNIGKDGKVISAYYDQGGTLLGENIPLELVAMSTADNTAIKTPMVGYTKEKLSDGELLTVVVYDDVGAAVSIAQVLARNTAFIRTTDASKRYITGVSLESPFLSDSDNKVIEYPINVPISSITMMGVVSYSDGTKKTMPVDGTKFSLYGLKNFVATILGQKIPVVLSYKLSADEFVYNASVGAGKHIAVEYTVTTTKVEGAYSVKLFAYPVWIDDLNGYRLEYFLYNLDREKVYYVTPYVSMGSNSKAFSPTEYGVSQELTVALDLRKVDGRFAAYRHVQTLTISLLRPGNENGDNWTIAYEPGQNPPYGKGLVAAMKFINTNYWELDLSCGFNSQEEWLRNVYYNTLPLYNSGTEAEAPTPNFFRMHFNGKAIECAVSQWNTTMVVDNDLSEGEVLFLEFFRRTSTTDLELGASGLVMHQTT